MRIISKIKRLFRKAGKLILGIPILRREFENLCHAYSIEQLNRGFEPFRGFENLCRTYSTERLNEGLEPFQGFENIRQIYAVKRVEQGIDAFRGESEFHAVLSSEILAPIAGAFNKNDATALAKVVAMVRKESIKIAEIGSWTGMSTAVLAKSVADYQGSVFAIDHWLGNEGTPLFDTARNHDIYSVFKRNMAALGLQDIVHPLVMSSQTASKIFADGVLDLVFIDADHRYKCIKQDIDAWLPKLREGGVLCGHDCEGYYSEYCKEDQKRIDAHPEDDCIATINDYTPPVDAFSHHICHPGVVKALHEDLQERYKIIPNSAIWYYLKTVAGEVSEKEMSLGSTVGRYRHMAGRLQSE